MSATSSQMRDAGVQTEPTEALACDLMPGCSPDAGDDDVNNDNNISPEFSENLDLESPQKPVDTSRHPTTVFDPLLDQAVGLENGLILLSSPRIWTPSLDDVLSSGLANRFSSIGTVVGDSEPAAVESLHDLAMVGGYSFWLEEAYTNLYFSITHITWPFLNCKSWSSWHHDWSLDNQGEPWKGFFVRMVHAIGSLSCNTLQPSRDHSKRAAEMYSSAMSYYPYVMEEVSPILQIQASILMILYSLHCPSSGEISMSVSSIVPFCSATLADIQKRISFGSDGFMEDTVRTGVALTESMFITCYMLNEIVVSGWERPVSAAYKIVDDDVRLVSLTIALVFTNANVLMQINTLSNEIPGSTSTSASLRHLFRLRKLQSNIRRYWADPTRNLCPNDASFKLELDAWRQDIPQYFVEGAPSTYLHPLWMTKLYDYSVVILMQGKRKNLKHEDVDDVLSAGVEVCLNYRRLQEEGQVMCYTWSAVGLHYAIFILVGIALTYLLQLVFQFRTGVLLLYILRLAVLDSDSIQQAFDAVCTCADSLTCFANSWHDATPYAKIFDFLLHNASWIPEELRYWPHCGCSFDEMETYLKQLKKQYLHKEALDMIEDMIYTIMHDRP
jgi:hypothetical protein